MQARLALDPSDAAARVDPPELRRVDVAHDGEEAAPEERRSEEHQNSKVVLRSRL